MPFAIGLQNIIETLFGARISPYFLVSADGVEYSRPARDDFGFQVLLVPTNVRSVYIL